MKFLKSCSLLLAFVFSAFGQVAPGPEHAELKKMEGTWTGKVKMGDMESTGTITYKMELGGLWLVSTYQGEMFGQKYEGRGMDTYNPAKKKYVSVWADSMSAQPMTLEGTYDKEKKVLTMKGEAPSPEDKPFKMVTEFKDDDHHTFTMYVINDDGKEEKVMSIDYTRKK